MVLLGAAALNMAIYVCAALAHFPVISILFAGGHDDAGEIMP